MKQIEFFEIKNPCIGVCENGPRGFCRGCFRSREERQHWNLLEQDVKRQIIKACAARERRAKLKCSRDAQDDDGSPQVSLF